MTPRYGPEWVQSWFRPIVETYGVKATEAGLKVRDKAIYHDAPEVLIIERLMLVDEMAVYNWELALGLVDITFALDELARSMAPSLRAMAESLVQLGEAMVEGSDAALEKMARWTGKQELEKDEDVEADE